VVTNLDREHMDCYRDMDDVENAYVAFMDKVPFYGAVTACIDNPQLAAILPRARRRVFTYGAAREADYRLEPLPTADGAFSRFQVTTATRPLGPFELHVPGRHNVLNATAAVAIAHQLEIDPAQIAEGISHFRGVDRRFQLRGQAHGITVIDDYGHHPTEIRATLSAARDCGYRQIHVVFQPHRYTRTHDLLDQFAGAFIDADTVTVLPIYAASEKPIPGITAEVLAGRIEGPRVEFAPDFGAALDGVLGKAHEGDLILTLGAGSVSQLAPQIVASLEAVEAH
jgi:UDP-N-acetylmuramate--alanine ligase